MEQAVTLIDVDEPIMELIETLVGKDKPITRQAGRPIDVAEPITKKKETTIVVAKPIPENAGTTIRVDEPIIEPTEPTVEVEEPITEQSETLIDIEEQIDVSDPEVILPVHSGKETGTFNVFRRDDFPSNTNAAHNRLEFYKISFIRGTGVLHYADRNIEIDRDALIFSNPNVPYSWEINPKTPGGYFCVFTEEFFSRRNRLDFLSESEFFRTGGNPVVFPEEDRLSRINSLFRTMRREMEGDYAHKYDLQHSYVMLLIHEAQKIQAANAIYKHGQAAVRLATLFTDLLERQFPIDSPEHVFKMRTANDYAVKLDIHVNHLNRVVKEVTGKTTTDHIAARIVVEATNLLKKTKWSVAEIAFSLGFEYPAYFCNFFKKQTGLTPGSMRGSGSNFIISDSINFPQTAGAIFVV